MGIRILILLIVFAASSLMAQDVVRSDKTTVQDGKMYYLHAVSGGQTLYSIAKAYEVSVKDILELNPDAEGGLKPGQELRIPYTEVKRTVQEDKNQKFRTHKVSKGETWYSIAKKYNVSVDQLKALNAEFKENLKAGQEIRIPSIGNPIKDPGKDVVVQDPRLPIQVSTAADTTALKKPEYNIGFLLPFNLGLTDLIEPEKIKKGTRSFPDKARIAIEFYHGVQLALDSLKNSGIKVHAFYFDTGADSSGTSWAKDPQLQKMDLLIGPFFTNSFTEANKIAKKLGITIVAPTLQNNKILIGNPQVNKASASVYTQMEEIGKFAAEQYTDQNIMVVSSGGPKDQTLVHAVRNAGSKRLLELKMDSMKLVNGLGGVTGSLTKEKINVVILPSNNQSYVTDFLSRLYKTHLDRKDSIIVIGMNAWAGFENLDHEYLNGMAFHYPSNSWVDYKDTATIRFVSKYRELYKTEPSDHSYDAFDITLYYAGLLGKHGVRFSNKLVAEQGQGLNMRFRYAAAGTDSGFENTGVFILRYRDFSLIRAN